MPRSLHLTTEAADAAVTVSAGTKKKAKWDAGSAAQLYNVNCVGGPTAGVQLTDSTTAGTNGTAITWFSPPLEAVTIDGAISFWLWARESATNSNAAATFRIERCDYYGNVISTIVSSAVNKATGELATTAAGASVVNTVAAGNVSTTVMADRDRLKITLMIDDASDHGGTGSMGAGNVQFWVNSGQQVQGSAKFTFAEELREWDNSYYKFIASSNLIAVNSGSTPANTPCQASNLRILFCASIGTTVIPTFNTPAGWSPGPAGNTANGLNQASIAWFYQWCVGGEAAPTVSGSNIPSGGMYVVMDEWLRSGDWHANGGVVATNTSGTTLTPAVTTTVPSQVFTGVFVPSGTATNEVVKFGGGVQGSSGNFAHVTIAYGRYPTPGELSPTVLISMNAGRSAIAASMAFQPATSPPGIYIPLGRRATRGLLLR